MGLALEELNEGLRNWIDNVYHRCELSSLETTPLVRWQRDIAHVRRLPPAIDLRRLFFDRRVTRAPRLPSADILPEHSYESPPNITGPTSEPHDTPIASEVKTCFSGQSQGPAPLVGPVNDVKIPSVRSTGQNGPHKK